MVTAGPKVSDVLGRLLDAIENGDEAAAAAPRARGSEGLRGAADGARRGLAASAPRREAPTGGRAVAPGLLRAGGPDDEGRRQQRPRRPRRRSRGRAAGRAGRRGSTTGRRIATGATMATWTAMCRSSQRRSQAGGGRRGGVLTPVDDTPPRRGPRAVPRVRGVSPTSPHWPAFAEWMGTLSDLSGTQMLLGWDRETLMPPGRGRVARPSDGHAGHPQPPRDRARGHGRGPGALAGDPGLDDDARAMVRLVTARPGPRRPRPRGAGAGDHRDLLAVRQRVGRGARARTTTPPTPPRSARWCA